MNQSSKTDYFIKTGSVDLERMNILNTIFNPETQKFLLHHNISKGQKILDVACGTGQMTAWLAQQVGEQGEVVAIDQDEQQLAIAKDYVHKLGLNNITFRQCSVHELDQHYPDFFDLAYTRFLLIHLDKPIDAIQSMINAIKPGGHVAIVSATHDNFFSHPTLPEMEIFKDFCKRVLSKNDRDWQFGRKLPGEMAKLNLNDIHAYVHSPCLMTYQEKRFYDVAIEIYKDSMSQEGLSDEEIEKLQTAMKHFCETDDSYCYGLLTTMFAAGRKE